MFTGKKLSKIFLALIAVQALINLIGALGPELGFDALWYHLTEAKLFLQNHSIDPIPGNLLYWSGLPRLAEIIYMYLPGKLVHWGAGILAAYFIYRLSGAGAALLWYSTLLVGWLSTSAYVDLLAVAMLLGALLFKKGKRIIFLILAGAVKLQNLIYALTITLIPWAVLGYLPFMMINYQSTGNPVYPFGEKFGFESEWFFNGFWYWLSRPLRLFFDPVFRVGPVILLAFLVKPKWSKMLLAAFGLWILMPGTDFGRFALFPLALLALAVKPPYKKVIVGLILIQALIGIGGRLYANSKYLPVLTGKQPKAEFLQEKLKFHYGDFYDVDGWFAKNIQPTDKVLIFGLHNLYYVNFPYDHASWIDWEATYSHILMGDGQELPEAYGKLPLIYENPQTRVKVYATSIN